MLPWTWLRKCSGELKTCKSSLWMARHSALWRLCLAKPIIESNVFFCREPAEANVCSLQIPKKSRLLSKQPRAHLHHRRQCQVHAPHEPRPSSNALLQLRLAAALAAFDGQAKHTASQQPKLLANRRCSQRVCDRSKSDFLRHICHFHSDATLTQGYPAGIRGMGQMHDEPILRRESRDHEPHLPQQGCCSREAVSLKCHRFFASSVSLQESAHAPSQRTERSPEEIALESRPAR